MKERGERAPRFMEPRKLTRTANPLKAQILGTLKLAGSYLARPPLTRQLEQVGRQVAVVKRLTPGGFSVPQDRRQRSARPARRAALVAMPCQRRSIR